MALAGVPTFNDRRFYLLGVGTIMTRSVRCLFAAVGTLSFALSCTAGKQGGEFDSNEAEGTGGGTSAATTSGSSSTGDDVDLNAGSGGGSSGTSCDTGPDEDGDGDGFTVADGDCNDCDANVNPGAVEVVVTEPDDTGTVPEPADEDCDGEVDNVLAACDGDLALADTDPMEGAMAVDLCQQASDADRKWGVLSAAYVRADGSPAPDSKQFGLLNSFGDQVSVPKGTRMLGLSSGRARVASSSASCGNFSCDGYGPGSAPPGFPQDVPNCPGASDINDDIGLELRVRAPTNAIGYSFLFDFYTFEYPEWICTSYNDQFIALVNPAPEGSINGNISFDSQNNPVSVNIAFFDVCAGCPLGANELDGTGFDTWNSGGATSWLRTTAPVQGGDEFTIRFAIWDTGDQAYDSTVLVDSFEWIANGGTTVVVQTDPVPK
jgi:hypothetical protein